MLYVQVLNQGLAQPHKTSKSKMSGKVRHAFEVDKCLEAK